MICTEWKRYPDMEDAYKIRMKVFVEEQKVSVEEEIDEFDKKADHIVVYEKDCPIATGRLVINEGKYMLGRIAVIKEYRKQGYGDLVVRMLIRKGFMQGGETLYLHAQIHAVPFYEKLGFEVIGKSFMEAGIEHIEMRRYGDITGCCNTK